MGFCMGYEPGSQARQRFMTRYQRQLIGKSLGMMLRLDTGIYSRVWSYVKSKFKKSPPAPETPVHGPDGRGDLLSICVLEGYLGRGVSAALLQQFEAQLVQRGISQYTLSVNLENARARAFYEKSGMHAESASGGSVIYSKAIKL